MRFAPVFVLTYLVVSGFCATIADVRNDIKEASNRLSNLVRKVDEFPVSGGNGDQFNAIVAAAELLIVDIDKTAADAKTVPTPVSFPDGRAVLTDIEGLEPNIDKVLKDIVARKQAFEHLAAGALPAVIQEVKLVGASNTNMQNALISKAPAALQAEANAYKARINAAFAKTIKDLSS